MGLLGKASMDLSLAEPAQKSGNSQKRGQYSMYSRNSSHFTLISSHEILSRNRVAKMSAGGWVCVFNTFYSRYNGYDQNATLHCACQLC